MTGRGIDQVLPRPGAPELRERVVRDAREYVALAERTSGDIPRPVDIAWPWGAALDAIDEAAPDARVINVETSTARGGTFAPGKAVHYRMSPGNIECLAACRPDTCVLANNHVLDFGVTGLTDTLRALSDAGMRAAGAGQRLAEAREPAAVPVRTGGRLLVFAGGTGSSGIPASWAATDDRPGVHRLPDLGERTAVEIVEYVQSVRRPGDIVVYSLHWGPNWGYEVSEEESAFAHRLVDGGVDLVHGHSSHHPRPIEIYRERLILYGCGDLINDYEGISGYEEYRDDLRLLYFISVDEGTGAFAGLRMVPMRAARMRLRPASGADAEWLCSVLDAIGRPFGTRVDLDAGGALVANWR